LFFFLRHHPCFHSIFFHIHCLLILLSFDTTQPEVLTLNRPQINKNKWCEVWGGYCRVAGVSVFCVVMLWHCVRSSQHFEGTSFPWNVANCSQSDTVSHLEMLQTAHRVTQCHLKDRKLNEEWSSDEWKMC
jgi:hypothetical protein